jgi:hypothetical protein
MHQEVAAFGGADHAAGRGLPFLKILLGLWQLHDAGGGILERDELATAGQWNRIVKLARSDARVPDHQSQTGSPTALVCETGTGSAGAGGCT